ncbi:peptidase inhibitor family I36 protein [Streptomyces tubercidicus]
MRIRHMAAAGTAAAALTLGVALPASAGNAQQSAGRSTAVAAHPLAADLAAAKRCSKKVQVFQDASYENRRTTFTHNRRDLANDGWDNTISSAINRGNCTVTFYSNASYTGASFSLKKHHKEPHFGDHPGMHDSTSSIEFSR